MAGNYALTAVATDNGGATGTSTPINITVGSQNPFGGTAWAVPGIINAEDYDEGGAGVAYFDTTPGGSTGGEAHTLRADDVDADTSWVDPAVIWVAAASTEWLEYTINVAATGGYIIAAGLATTETTASYKVYIDTDSLTQVSIPNTGDWSTITAVPSAEVNLTAGTHILRFEILGGSYNFDNISITSTSNTNPTVSITSPADAATFASGADVIIDATAADSDGTVTKVEFYQNGNLLGEDLTSPYSYTWTGVGSGNYTLTAVATDNSASSTTSTAVNIMVGSQAPFGGTAWAVPGIIEAEDYDEGGAGVAYFDTTPGGSTGGEAHTLRAGDVDADTSWVDPAVIWVSAAATEWLEYTINVASTGGYIIATGLATTETTASYKVYIDGDSLTQVSIPNTGDWSTITDVPSTEVNLAVGEHILKFEILGGSFNFDNITVTSTSGNTNPTVSITSPADAATFASGDDVIIEATAADSDGTVTKVEFYQNGNLLGEDLTSPYSYTWASVSSGNYSLTAIATDNMGATTTSSIVTIIVSPVVLSLEDSYNQAGLNITYSRYGIKLEGNANKVSVADILILDISGKVLFQKERLDWVGTTEVSYTFDVDKIHIIRVQTSEGVSANKVIFKMY
ncbi:MAG: Ig-like domain-containing protein [Cyclobacteriaceae bacterium]|nr:Ig-like domain-containing protein [Cyclobacteriaceae bacterium]